MFHSNASSLAAADDDVLGMPPAAVSNGGALVICGGGDLPDEVYERFVDLAGGENARIVVIPTAYPFECIDDAIACHSSWFDLSVKSVDFLHAETREEADDEGFVGPLVNATGVWITGGDQGRLADIYRGTRAEREIKRILERGGVVGGTSAGASIMSRTMIRAGSLQEAVVDDGFALVSRTVIDQHFLIRSRQERLFNVLSTHRDQIGIGVDESTALFVQGSRLRVVGESIVVVCLAESEDRPEWMCRLKAGDVAQIVTRFDSEDALGRLDVRLQRRAPQEIARETSPAE
ncbi:MAG TPA: cyanophycinase [Pirellulales bacterium]|nr:cyanophycinase [Pirellulales bacterium]